jgi:hypothetical protein
MKFGHLRDSKTIHILKSDTETYCGLVSHWEVATNEMLSKTTSNCCKCWQKALDALKGAP